MTGPREFRDMDFYVKQLTSDMDVESVLDVGTGNKGVVAQQWWENAKGIKRGYACDIWRIKPLPPVWTPLKVDALTLLDVLGAKSLDVVQAFGFLEHLPKEQGYRFLGIAERLAKKAVIVSAAAYCHGPTRDYKVKIDGNPYHYYHSAWDWADFADLGYQTNWWDMHNKISFEGEAIAWKKLDKEG